MTNCQHFYIGEHTQSHLCKLHHSAPGKLGQVSEDLCARCMDNTDIHPMNVIKVAEQGCPCEVSRQAIYKRRAILEKEGWIFSNWEKDLYNRGGFSVGCFIKAQAKTTEFDKKLAKAFDTDCGEGIK